MELVVTYCGRPYNKLEDVANGDTAHFMEKIVRMKLAPIEAYLEIWGGNVQLNILEDFNGYEIKVDSKELQEKINSLITQK